jgi:hypothetical protein
MKPVQKPAAMPPSGAAGTIAMKIVLSVIGAFLVLTIIVGVIAGAITSPSPPPETPAQAQAREARTAAQVQARETRAAANELKRSRCRLQSMCAKYGEVRQQCAIAGNFNNCVTVRMGGADIGRYDCTDDGKIVWKGPVPADMPNRLECLFLGVF